MRTPRCLRSLNHMLLTLQRLACPIINILSQLCLQETIILPLRRTPTVMQPMGLRHLSLPPIQVALWGLKYHHKV